MKTIKYFLLILIVALTYSKVYSQKDSTIQNSITISTGLNQGYFKDLNFSPLNYSISGVNYGITYSRINNKSIFLTSIDFNNNKINTIQQTVFPKSKYLQGDFMGVKTKTFEDTDYLIDVNIMSQNPDGEQLDKEGYDGKGIIEYEGYCEYNIDISNKDLIEFIDNYGYNITTGQKFKIEMKDEGLYRGQYCYKNFKLTRI
jgi:hypothetical protein